MSSLFSLLMSEISLGKLSGKFTTLTLAVLASNPEGLEANAATMLVNSLISLFKLAIWSAWDSTIESEFLHLWIFLSFPMTFILILSIINVINPRIFIG